MIKVYLIYPNAPHVTIHKNPTCSNIQKRQKTGQRILDINLLRMSNELIKINDKKFQTFRSDKDANDMWIYIGLNDYDYEIATLNYICRILSKRFNCFKERVHICC